MDETTLPGVDPPRVDSRRAVFVAALKLFAPFAGGSLERRRVV